MNMDCGIPLTSLQVDGGMTVNNLLMQLQADILGISVGMYKILVWLCLIMVEWYFPFWISNDLPWLEYEYFLEPLILWILILLCHPTNELQSNLPDTDTEGTKHSVCIREVSVL